MQLNIAEIPHLTLFDPPWHPPQPLIELPIFPPLDAMMGLIFISVATHITKKVKIIEKTGIKIWHNSISLKHNTVNIFQKKFVNFLHFHTHF